MATATLLSVPVQPTPSISLGPQRGLAGATTLVALATGCFLPLHLLGVLNLLFGYPAISPNSVILASLTGVCLSAIFLHRIGIIKGSDVFQLRSIRPPKEVTVVVALAAVPYAVFFLIGLFSFPNGGDPLAYDIDTALKWLQSGTMRVQPALGWQYSLPGNGELPALIALSAGMPGAVAIGNLFAAVLLATSVYLIARRVTHHIAPSLLAAVVAMTLPMVIFQTFELFVDMFGAAFLMPVGNDLLKRYLCVSQGFVSLWVLLTLDEVGVV